MHNFEGALCPLILRTLPRNCTCGLSVAQILIFNFWVSSMFLAEGKLIKEVCVVREQHNKGLGLLRFTLATPPALG